MRQGDIWWTDLPEPAGRHPVLVLTRTRAIRVLTNVTVVPITSTVRGLDTEVELGREQGLTRRRVANFDNVTTLPKHLLDTRAGSVDPITLQICFDALRHAFDVP